MNKDEVFRWMCSRQDAGESIPVVINGGGFQLLDPDTTIPFDRDDDYEDEVEILEKGSEYGDFRDLLPSSEYEGMEFVRIRHRTKYGQENMDIEIGTWDLDLTQ